MGEFLFLSEEFLVGRQPFASRHKYVLRTFSCRTDKVVLSDIVWWKHRYLAVERWLWLAGAICLLAGAMSYAFL
jgi:hypothetical protein